MEAWEAASTKALRGAKKLAHLQNSKGAVRLELGASYQMKEARHKRPHGV